MFWVDGWLLRPHFKKEVKLLTGLEEQECLFHSNLDGPAMQLHCKEKCQSMERNSLEELKAHLMQTDERFRGLAAQHHEYARLIDELESKPVLTADEEVEEHRLKKLKLRLKDEMESMMLEHAAHA